MNAKLKVEQMIEPPRYNKLLVWIAICLAIAGISAACCGKIHALYATVVLTPIFLCFAFVEHIAEFKAGKSGFEAKTRGLITDAKSAVEGVHELALLHGKMTLDLLSKAMQWEGHYQPEEVEKLKQETVQVLREMGIPLEAIKEKALAGWYRNMMQFYRGRLTSYWVAARPEVQAEMKKLHKLGDEELAVALRETYSKLGILDRDEVVKDFQHLVKTREHRRPDRWLDIQKMECLK